MKEKLLTLINQIILTFDGQEFEDKYGVSRFQDGIWFTLKENGDWEEMMYKKMDCSDLIGEIEALMGGINKKYPDAEIKILLVGVDVDI